jgi:hypothetical protein
MCGALLVASVHSFFFLHHYANHHTGTPLPQWHVDHRRLSVSAASSGGVSRRTPSFYRRATTTPVVPMEEERVTEALGSVLEEVESEGHLGELEDFDSPKAAATTASPPTDAVTPPLPSHTASRAQWRRLQLRVSIVHRMFPHTNTACTHDRSNSYVAQEFSTLGRHKLGEHPSRRAASI